MTLFFYCHALSVSEIRHLVEIPYFLTVVRQGMTFSFLSFSGLTRESIGTLTRTIKIRLNSPR